MDVVSVLPSSKDPYFLHFASYNRHKHWLKISCIFSILFKLITYTLWDPCSRSFYKDTPRCAPPGVSGRIRPALGCMQHIKTIHKLAWRTQWSFFKISVNTQLLRIVAVMLRYSHSLSNIVSGLEEKKSKIMLPFWLRYNKSSQIYF